MSPFCRDYLVWQRNCPYSEVQGIQCEPDGDSLPGDLYLTKGDLFPREKPF
jgi:hypothetical protein